MSREAFEAWWNNQDTKGLSDACRFSAWNAWQHQQARIDALEPAEKWCEDQGTELPMSIALNKLRSLKKGGA